MSEATEFPSIRRLLETRTPPERLPEVVSALAPAIERGHHVAVVASEGARLCRLYSAAAIHDLAGGDEARGLVLVATPDRGRRLARSIERFGSALGWETVMWTAERVASGAPIHGRSVIVATPARLLEDLRAGRVSLGDLRLLALDDVRGMAGAWPAVEALLQATNGDARRIAVTHARDEAFDELVERRLARARRWPAELFAEEVAPTGPPLRVTAAVSHDARLERLVELLHGWAAERPGLDRGTVWCEDAATAASIRAALAIEGLAVAEDPGDAGYRVTVFESAIGAGDDGAAASDEPSVGVGLPWTAEELEASLGGRRMRAAIVAPRHLRQLEILAARLGWRCRPLPETPDAFRDDIDAFRAHIEDAIESRDLATAALLLDPLIEAHGYARVSAALASLLRAAGTPAPGAEPAVAAEEPSPDAARATRPTWSRVFVNVGRQDGVSPGDLVGAITGETPASGAQIGKIEIRQRFSLIDVDSMVVDGVIRGLAGAKIKNRDVTVRLDRGR